ncbi:MAG: hypothetical protein KC636_07460 [Myxococcales bacterium]|nr:hypothetical protein [Myxococcales bacterium]
MRPTIPRFARIALIAPLIAAIACAPPPVDDAAAREARDALAEATTELRQATVALERATAQLDIAAKALQGRQGAAASEDAEEPAPDASRVVAGLAEAVACRDGRCTVERAWLNEQLNNPEQLARQVRLIPTLEEGEVVGYKLYAIRPGSMVRALGFKNGDLIAAVNGTPLRSTSAALDMYRALRRASRFDVSIVRKGEPEQIVVEVIGADANPSEPPRPE